MKTIALVTVLAAAGLAACSPAAKEESSEAANAMMSDANVTAVDAMNSVDMATDNMMAGAANTMDAAGDKMDAAANTAATAADKMKAAAGDAMSAAGNTVAETGEMMKK
ncbi:MAG: hypothetical protein ACKVOP_05400 [Sphingomonadaceae bacterium]